MKRGTPEHPKVHALAATLGIQKYAAVGILESLWHFAQEYAQDGAIGRYPDDAIARWIGWDGASTVLVDGLVAAGWLDRCECHGLRVHDWKQHADQTVRRVLESRGQHFAACYDDPSTMLAATKLPCRAVPSLAKPTDVTDSAPKRTARPRARKRLPPESASAVKEACEDWTELLGGTAPGSRIAGAWPGLLRLVPWVDVRPVWRWYLAEGKRSGKAEFCNAQDFATRFDYWKARALGVVDPDAWKRGRQPHESAVEANARVLEAVEQGRL